MMTENDKELQSFFDQMREKNGKIQVPHFPEPTKKSSLNWWIPMGIAASLALGFFLWPHGEQIQSPPTEVIVITLGEDENNKQQILIEEKTYLETWESPTASLLADY